MSKGVYIVDAGVVDVVVGREVIQRVWYCLGK